MYWENLSLEYILNAEVLKSIHTLKIYLGFINYDLNKDVEFTNY